MANHWAIAIGVNQYQHFQPLSYAQRDAQGFRDFLVKEVGFSPEHCLLLTDVAADIDSHPTYPNRENIQSALTELCQQRLQAGDLLWCLFSGYGVRFEGKDYLMPIEADPAEIATTGIPIDFLFSTLQTAPTDNIILVLDVNRSQSVLPGEGVGDQTALLAREHGIATILSCPPNQFSYETLALRQGLFTTALIEGIRDRGCVTLDHLVKYLSDRLPELSEQHWRPRQDPFAIIPPEKKYQLIVPEKAAVMGVAATVTGATESPATGSQFYGRLGDALDLGNSFQNMAALPQNWTPIFAATDSATATLPKVPSLLSNHPGNLQERAATIAPIIPREADIENLTDEQTVEDQFLPEQGLQEQPLQEQAETDALFWKRLLTWGGIVAGALLLGVVLRNGGLLMEGAPAKLPAPAPDVPTQPESPAAVQSASPGDAGISSDAAASPSLTPSPQPAIPAPMIPVDVGAVKQAAQTALAAKQYEEAKRQLEQVPVEQQDADYNTLLEQANREVLNEAKTMLIRTRDFMAENQASDFVEAIKKARLIKPNQPLYQEAQQNMDRWSQVIMDMAQGRAQRPNDMVSSIAAGNYNAAIATARLVPDDRKVYAQAQDAVAMWSQMILDLAKARATEGNLDAAIQIGELVPSNTPVYAQAQEAIANWRNQPSPSSTDSLPLPSNTDSLPSSTSAL